MKDDFDIAQCKGQNIQQQEIVDHPWHGNKSSHKIKTKDQTYNVMTKDILNQTFEWPDQNVTHFRQNLAKKEKKINVANK